MDFIVALVIAALATIILLGFVNLIVIEWRRTHRTQRLRDAVRMVIRVTRDKRGS